MPSPKHRLTDGSPEYEYGIRTSPPPLAEVLENAGCRLFLDAMRKAGRFEGANSITIIAPNDGAFPSGACALLYFILSKAPGMDDVDHCCRLDTVIVDVCVQSAGKHENVKTLG